jgi:hypothetical protein
MMSTAMQQTEIYGSTVYGRRQRGRAASSGKKPAKITYPGKWICHGKELGLQVPEDKLGMHSSSSYLLNDIFSIS